LTSASWLGWRRQALVAAGWTSPDARTATSLVPGRLHLWRVDLDGPDAHGVATIYGHDLSVDERQRAARFRSPVDARRWAVARAALRRILATYLDEEPAALVFELGPQGKPGLAGPTGQDLRFNLSHSAAIAVVVVSVGHPVGVDVEWIRDEVDVVALARRALPARAVAELVSTPPNARTRVFFRLWVRHEASVKCLGTGIGTQSVDDDADGPVVGDVALGVGYAGALAVAPPGHGPRAEGWDPGRVSRWEWVAPNLGDPRLRNG
jgi:4'-phosphopantetheinyl transferase